MRITQHHTHNPEPEPDPEPAAKPRSYSGIINDDIVIYHPATVNGVINGDVIANASITVNGIISGDIIANAPVNCSGTISGDIVMNGALLTNSGIISGDVTLKNGAELANTGVVSGDVDREGGRSRSRTRRAAHDSTWSEERATVEVGGDANESLSGMFKKFSSLGALFEDLDHASSSSSITTTINGHKFKVEAGKLVHDGRIVDARPTTSSKVIRVSGGGSQISLGGFQVHVDDSKIRVNGKPIRYI